MNAVLAFIKRYSAATYFALVVVILLGLGLAAPGYQLGVVTAANKGSLLAVGIGWGLLGGGLLEELGWTGFAVPTLRERRTALTTGLALVTYDALSAACLWLLVLFLVLAAQTRLAARPPRRGAV